MITNSKDDTATWNCGRWTWTIGLPLVAMLFVATVAGQDRFVFIGGNSHERVIPCAKALGASYFVPTQPSDSSDAMMRENRQWIDEVMSNSVPIIDLGPAPGPRPIGPFYAMERARVLHGGTNGKPYSRYRDVTRWSETEDNTTPQPLRRLLQAAQDCARGVKIRLP